MPQLGQGSIPSQSQENPQPVVFAVITIVIYTNCNDMTQPSMFT